MASAKLSGQSLAFKNELLFQQGINFNDVPSWQKRGSRFYWELYEKQGVNPQNSLPVTAVRQKIKVDDDLPVGEAYTQFIHSLLISS